MKTIPKLEPLQANNTIYIGIDESCDMATVDLNGNCVMLGNFWDFHNGCHGFYDMRDFRGYRDLAALVETYILRRGLTCQVVVDDQWEYKD